MRQERNAKGHKRRIERKRVKRLLTLCLGTVILFGVSHLAFATDVRIWDDNLTNWSTTFANGDPIDTGTANNASVPQIAIDSNGIVYVAFAQFDGTFTRIYLSRYDGTDVRIWDNDTASWTRLFANGDPIDTGTDFDASQPQIAIDSSDRVYVTFIQNDGTDDHVYLSRYDALATKDMRIWDNDAPGWTTTFDDGDPIDRGTANNAAAPQLAVDSQGMVYVVYEQDDGVTDHIYLSRYDGTDVRIWDNNSPGWITDFANGDPIDTGMANQASTPRLAIDSSNRVYVTYAQISGAIRHIYVSRYDATAATPRVRIWDNDLGLWITSFANGDPIDTGTANNARTPKLAVDPDDRVYITYVQNDGTGDHIFLSRWEDVTKFTIWDNDAPGWASTFADGDPIDTGTGNDADEPWVAIDSDGRVYVTYLQPDGANNHVYLSRYDVLTTKDVRIWDNDSSQWTTTFADGDPIDTGTAFPAAPDEPVIDSDDRVYIPVVQAVGSVSHIYLSRYDVLTTKDVRIWDNDGTSWTNTFADGDPIDRGTADDAHAARLAIDSSDRVYVTFTQSDGANDHVYLSRFVETTPAGADGTSGGGCFLATAAYGSPMEPHVQILRTFRDRFLLTNSPGKAFVRLYYIWSPPVAAFISNHESIKTLVRWSLLPLVGVSYAALYLGARMMLTLLVLLLSLGGTLVFYARRRRAAAGTMT